MRKPLTHWPNAPRVSIAVMPRWPEVIRKRISAIVGIHRRKEERPSYRIRVRQRLRAPHKVTRLAQDALLSAEPDDYGVVKCEDKEAFLVRVAPATVRRALLILDALVKACEKRGFTVKPGREGDPGQARFVVNGEEIDFRIEEYVRSSVVPFTEEEMRRIWRGHRKPHKHTYHPTGELALRVRPSYRGGPQTTWKDSGGRPVEEVLNDVIISMVHVAMLKREERKLEAEHDRQERQEVEHLSALTAEEAHEAEALEQLKADAAAWHEAQAIHAYLDAVEARARAEGVLATGGELDHWLAMARELADQLDPVGGYDEPVPDERPATPGPGTPGDNVVSFLM